MQVIFTAVPSGFSNEETLQLAVVVTFKNDPAATDLFGLTATERDALRNWPAYLEKLLKVDSLASGQFKVSVQPTGSNDTLPIDAQLPFELLKAKAWAALMDPYRPFNSYVSPLADGAAPMTSYPMWKVHETLRSAYSNSMELAMLAPSEGRSELDGPGRRRKAQRAALDQLPIFVAKDVSGNRIVKPAPGRGGAEGAEGVDLKVRTVGIDGLDAQAQSLRLAHRGLRNLHRVAPHAPAALQEDVQTFLMNVLGLADVVGTYTAPVDGDAAGRAAESNVRDAPYGHEFLQQATFHMRVPKRAEMPRSDAKADAAAGSLSNSPGITSGPDVFQQMGLIQNYPALLEPLGLVLLLDVPLNPVMTNITSGRICVAPAVDIGVTKTTHPWTQFECTAPAAGEPGWFRAADRGTGATYRGFLDLKGQCKRHPNSIPIPADRFQLADLDIDGSGLKFVNMTMNVARERGAILYTDPADPFGAIRDLNVTAADLLFGQEHSAEDFPKTLLRELVEHQGVFTQYSDESIRTRAWNTLRFDTPVKNRFDTDTLVKKKPATSLTATAIRDNGVLVEIRWQLYAGNGYRTDDDIPLPSLRTMGVGLMWKDRAVELRETAKRRATLLAELKANGMESDLYAEDLILGYVPEVEGKSITGKEGWHSLTARHERYDIEGLDQVNAKPNRDAVLRLAAIQPLDSVVGSPSSPMVDLHAGETVFNWRGSPLGVESKVAVLRDGQNERFKKLEKREESERKKREESGTKSDQDEWCVPVNVTPDWNEFVPLRFSRTSADDQYELRVAIVDAAGKRRYAREANEVGALSFSHRRFEPVLPPAILLDKPLGPEVPGRALLRMVVTGAYVDDTRWAAPPRTSKDIAERHDAFIDQPPKDTVGFRDVWLREDGSFPTAEAPADSVRLPIRRSGAGCPIPKAPYLPDPLAMCLVARLVWRSTEDARIADELMSTNVHLNLYDKRPWPSAKAARLRLVAKQNGEPTLKARQRDCTLVVELPPGATAWLEVCSSPFDSDEGDLEAPAVLALCEEYVRKYKDRAGKAQGAAMRARDLPFVANLCPPLRIECTHAVATPLVAPVIARIHEEWRLSDNLVAVPRPDADPKDQSTKVPLTFDVCVDPASTGKVRMRASWRDDVDRPGDSPPGCESRAADLGELYVDSDLGSGKAPLLPWRLDHSFPDTGYHQVTYQATALTRHREHFQALRPPAGQVDGPKYVVNILNRANPPVPQVAYVVPTFGWVQNVTTAASPEFQSIRKGGGLRIWLDRPWYCSGSGELLGVALAPHKVGEGTEQDPVVKQLREVTTVWGLDPLRAYQDILEWPTVDMFKDYDRVDRGLPLLGDLTPVNVVGYTPEFCGSTKRWYCDIVIDPVPADFCFIRLALLRYQPKSLNKCELSSVVLADFAQLLPDRIVSVSRDARDPNRRTLRVHVFASPPPLTAAPAELPLLQTEIEVAIFHQLNDGRWVEESSDVVVEKDEPVGTRDPGWLWSGRIIWASLTGPRRLVVREYESTKTSIPEKPAARRIIYMDVLEV